jgi:hypothetical protein
MRPALYSFAINSSMVKAAFDKAIAACLFSGSDRSIYSSLKLRIADGSIPISGVSGLMNPR